jgi:hypothetical protein
VFPLPQEKACYKYPPGLDECMALVRSVDVPEHIIGLYNVVISLEM